MVDVAFGLNGKLKGEGKMHGIEFGEPVKGLSSREKLLLDVNGIALDRESLKRLDQLILRMDWKGFASKKLMRLASRSRVGLN